MMMLGSIGWLFSGCVYHEPVAYGPAPYAPAPTGVSVSGGVTVDEPTEVVVHEAPPPPVVERMTVTPGPAFVWVRGFWFWDNGHWTWERGHWVRPPRRSAVWVPPRYIHRGGSYVIIRGYWR